MAIAVSEFMIFLFIFIFISNFPFCFRYPITIIQYDAQESKGTKKAINPKGNEYEITLDLRK